MFKTLMAAAALTLLTACGGVCSCPNCTSSHCVCAEKGECTCNDAAKGGVCENCHPKH